MRSRKGSNEGRVCFPLFLLGKRSLRNVYNAQRSPPTPPSHASHLIYASTSPQASTPGSEVTTPVLNGTAGRARGSEAGKARLRPGSMSETLLPAQSCRKRRRRFNG